MATTLIPAHTFVIRASSSGNNTRRKTTTTSAAANTAGGGKWWAPIFGWSSDADYIDSSKEETAQVRPAESAAPKSKFSGCFTEEKAKRFRMMTKDTASFHDAMYHSAIASRLASDFSDYEP